MEINLDLVLKLVKIVNKGLNLISKDSEKRKLAEQRAKRRAKGQIIEEKVIKGKPASKKKRIQTNSFKSFR